MCGRWVWLVWRLLGGSLYQEKPFFIRGKLVAISAAQEPLVSQPEEGHHNKDEQPRWPVSLQESCAVLGAAVVEISLDG